MIRVALVKYLFKRTRIWKRGLPTNGWVTGSALTQRKMAASNSPAPVLVAAGVATNHTSLHSYNEYFTICRRLSPTLFHLILETIL